MANPPRSAAAVASRALPAGVRALADLRTVDISALGEEVNDLAVLAEAGVPIAPGWVVSFSADVDEVAQFIGDVLRDPPRRPTTAIGSMPPPPDVAPCIKLRPWFRTMALGSRAEDRWPALADAHDPEEVVERVEAAFIGVRSPTMTAATALAPDGVSLRVLLCDDATHGSASSIDPDDGDPSCVAVWLPERRPFRIDRRSMRPIEEEPGQTAGRGSLARSVLERVADLADRAQLALGRPITLDWVLWAGRPCVARIRPLRVTWRYTDESWRMVTLLWHDEGPIAPLAIDALDKALREERDAVDEPRVARLFARPYRRIEEGRGRAGERRHPFGAAAARVAQTATDVARPIAAARAFARTLDERLASFDKDHLKRFDATELARAVRERQGVVIEAYALLDRGRQATAAVLGALEAALGSVPRECVNGLAAIRRTRSRRRLDERLARAAKELGELPTEVDPVPGRLRRTFSDLRAELKGKRSLGLDLRPLSYGSSDAALVAGMRAARDGRAERAEREQRQAIRRLMATARARPLGRGRAALAKALTVMLERLADAKGRVAEGLADAHLRLQEVALEVGRRLVEQGVLDEAEDALYLYVSEIQEALAGEPGAYTARVRLRREEDDRWRTFEPATRILARARPQRPSWRSPDE